MYDGIDMTGVATQNPAMTWELHSRLHNDVCAEWDRRGELLTTAVSAYRFRWRVLGDAAPPIPLYQFRSAASGSRRKCMTPRAAPSLLCQKRIWSHCSKRVPHSFWVSTSPVLSGRLRQAAPQQLHRDAERIKLLVRLGPIFEMDPFLASDGSETVLVDDAFAGQPKMHR
jgi:hypothetical protein